MICVYKLTNKVTKKHYIGYTTKGLDARWNTHVKNAFSLSVDTHLYRSMRKHGESSFDRCVLVECDTELEAKTREIEFICAYDTLVDGYNMTTGGDGGNTWANKSDEWWEWFHQHRSECSTTSRNGRWSGYTDDELVQFGIDLCKSTGLFHRKGWLRYAKLNGYPTSFSKNRFNGSFSVFKEMVLIRCKDEGVEVDTVYCKSASHKAKLSASSRLWCFATNGIETKKIKKTSTLPAGWRYGRTLRNTND